MMTDLELLVDLHISCERQGPGGQGETELAMRLTGVDWNSPLKIAEIGCGTGAAALRLAQCLNARITAVDLFQDFLDVLKERAKLLGVADRISTLACSMDRLEFAEGEMDLIWSEGAIYNIGFERGVSEWRRFLKTDGLLVASEITWITDERPRELEDYWNREYPGIDVASAKFRILEKHGFSPVGYFVLPEHCWLENYYRPLQAQFDRFLDRHGQSEAARSIVAETEREIELYETYKSFYSYGMYIAKKVGMNENGLHGTS